MELRHLKVLMQLYSSDKSLHWALPSHCMYKGMQVLSLAHLNSVAEQILSALVYRALQSISSERSSH